MRGAPTCLIALASLVACSGTAATGTPPPSSDSPMVDGATPAARADAAAASGTDAAAGADAATPPAADATLAACPAAPPLGATPYAGAVGFAVWAPNADKVFVAGDFNGWSQTADELRMRAGGEFAGCVAGARVGHAYKFVLQHNGMTLLRNDPRARRVTNSVGNSVIVDPAAALPPAFRPAAQSEQVIYELHVGAFNDAPGGKPGTFRSVIERLDHVAALGANMIELMPPAEFPGDQSWGYNPSFPSAPESAYGTPEDLKALIAAAHMRGIGVIVDVVHNHWGPNDLPMWCFDGECLGAGGVYFYTDDRGKTDWGPRPDYGRAAVRAYIRDSALTWFDEYRADGLRWDSTVNIRNAAGKPLPDGWALLQEINDAIHKRNPNALEIAEDFQGDARITTPTADNGAGFDVQWDGFFHAIEGAMFAIADDDRHMNTVRDALAGGARRVIYTESHDEAANGKQRAPQMIDNANPGSIYARKRSTLGAAMALTAPGTPMLFMGQEFLEDGYFKDSDPLDWTKVERFAPVLAFYRDLIALRRNVKGQTKGLTGSHVNVFHVNDQAKVIAFHRWANGGPGDDVVVAANFSSRAFPAYRIGLPRGGSWRVRLNGDARSYGADYAGTPSPDVDAQQGTRDGLGFQGDVGLGPYSVVVLSQ
jgi:1,4-alpha-glucan branching enzyme